MTRTKNTFPSQETSQGHGMQYTDVYYLNHVVVEVKYLFLKIWLGLWSLFGKGDEDLDSGLKIFAFSEYLNGGLCSKICK